jgi:Bacterial DNA-binding protein
MAVEKSQIVAKMRELLTLKKNDGICGVGEGGYRFDRFREDLLAAFSAEDREFVKDELFFLKKDPPFKFLRNKSGFDAVCYDPNINTAPTKKAAENVISFVGDTARTKAQIVSSIAQITTLDEKVVEQVLDALVITMKHALCLDGPGKIQISNLFKIVVDRESDPPVVNMNPMKPLQDIANQKWEELG